MGQDSKAGRGRHNWAISSLAAEQEQSLGRWVGLEGRLFHPDPPTPPPVP